MTTKPFPWKVGMTALIQFRDHPCAPIESRRMAHLVRVVGRDGLPDLGVHDWMDLNHDPQPDQENPATLGAFLGAVEEAWASVGVVQVNTPVRPGESWFILIINSARRVAHMFSAPTRFAVLEKAWREAP